MSYDAKRTVEFYGLQRVMVMFSWRDLCCTQYVVWVPMAGDEIDMTDKDAIHQVPSLITTAVQYIENTV